MHVSRLSERALIVCSLVVFHFRRLLRRRVPFFTKLEGSDTRRRTSAWHPGVHLHGGWDCHRENVAGTPLHLPAAAHRPTSGSELRVWGYHRKGAPQFCCSCCPPGFWGERTGYNDPNVTTTYYLCRCGEYHVGV